MIRTNLKNNILKKNVSQILKKGPGNNMKIEYIKSLFKNIKTHFNASFIGEAIKYLRFCHKFSKMEEQLNNVKAIIKE